jgi:hypothetical protein
MLEILFLPAAAAAIQMMTQSLCAAAALVAAQLFSRTALPYVTAPSNTLWQHTVAAVGITNP